MAKKIEIEFELKYKEAVKNLDEFQKEYSKLEKEVESANKKTAESLKKVPNRCAGCQAWQYRRRSSRDKHCAESRG